MSADGIRAREVEDWLYAGDLTWQLGPGASCGVAKHIQGLDAKNAVAIVHWAAIFDKVSALLRAEAGGRYH